MEENHIHMIIVREGERKLQIWRVYADGVREAYTKMVLPEPVTDNTDGQFREFCRLLGENLLLDSPKARALLGIA